MKQFYQCDVAESSTDSIWTSSVIYAASPEEAEFQVMLELQTDWGDGYIPDGFIDDFGSEAHEVGDPQFPGVDAWKAAGYFDDIPAVTGMLTVNPLTALAKLGKIAFDVPGDVVDAVMAGEARLHVVVDRDDPAHVPGLNEALAPKGGAGEEVEDRELHGEG